MGTLKIRHWLDLPGLYREGVMVNGTVHTGAAC